MNIKLLISIATVTAISACGSGTPSNGSSTEAQPPHELATLTGTLRNVTGLRYKSEKEAGFTNAEGEFESHEKSNISFYIGDIFLGETTAQNVLDLSNISNNDPVYLHNLKRFLLTLDWDQSPANGIQISNSIHRAATGLDLRFDIPTQTFEEHAESLLQTELASEEHLVLFDHIQVSDLNDSVKDSNSRSNKRSNSTFQYPSVAMEMGNQYPQIREEALSVFELMLQNTLEPGHSPLEYIFKVTNTPLELSAQEGSLVDLYALYKKRVLSIGQNAEYIPRKELANNIPERANLQSIHHFAVMSDFQIKDDESPLQVNPIKSVISSAYYPASAHIPYQIDDMIRTMRSYEDTENKPIELAIFTGDFTDISQYNEVRLGLDILDGGIVDPDSGADDDPIPGKFSDNQPNDTYDSFQALGLKSTHNNQTIPWYYVAGNHDGLCFGNVPISSSPLKLFGKTIRSGTRGYFDKISTGEFNWLGFDPSLSGFIDHLLTADSLKTPRDENRYLMDQEQIANELFNSSGKPHGHGMQHVIDQNGNLGNGLNYSFDSQNGLIKHIALDTNMSIGPQGWLDLQDIDWLKSELTRASDNGQLVIVSSHHKPKDIIMNGALLVQTLKSYPNVIAHLVAHAHQNSITPRMDGTHGSGYWEIESGSMVNWPQQFRMLDVLVDLESGTGIIKSTMLNHSAPSPLHVSQRGRFLSYLERYLEGSHDPEAALVKAEGKDSDRNALLYFNVPPRVLQNLNGQSIQ